jgi:hypothetical protein
MFKPVGVHWFVVAVACSSGKPPDALLGGRDLPPWRAHGKPENRV